MFAITGWLLALLLLALLTPKIIGKFTTRLPSSRPSDWPDLMLRKREDLARVPWTDSRPLWILAGDSHVEMGDWYHLFHGEFALRNCGLCGARIDDVAILVRSIPKQKAQGLIFMCGINDLAAGISVKACIESYRSLLLVNQREGSFQSLVAISVMPLRSSPLDARSRNINREVAKFNEQLRRLCATLNVKFIDVTDRMSNQSGALPGNFTQDGLHLNALGYRVLADRLSVELEPSLQGSTP